MQSLSCSVRVEECEQDRNTSMKRRTTSPCASEFFRDDTSYCMDCISSDLQGFNVFQKEFLDMHNEFRRNHGSPALFLSQNLCSFAQDVACTITSADVNEKGIKHEYGENVYMCNGFFPKAKHVVQKWYNEIEGYKFGFTDYSMNTCHLTQLLWKQSTQLGVGFSKK